MQDLPEFLADKKFVPEKQRDCYQHRVQHAFSRSRGGSKDGAAIHTFQKLLGQATLQDTQIPAQFSGCPLLGMHNPLAW